MLKRTDAITNEVLEPITFVLAYPILCTQYTLPVLQTNSVIFQPQGREDGVPSARANILIYPDTAQNYITSRYTIVLFRRYCQSVLEGLEDGILNLVLAGSWRLSFVPYSKTTTTFQELDLFLSSSDSLGRWWWGGGTY